MFHVFNFSYCIRFFVKVLIEMNVNISSEFNSSDVYQNINYIGSLAKITGGSFTLHAIQCSLHFDKPQKIKSNSLNNLGQLFTLNICSWKLTVKVTLEGQTIKWSLASVNNHKLKFLVHKYQKQFAI